MSQLSHAQAVELIERYIDNDLADAELTRLLNWLDADDQNLDFMVHSVRMSNLLLSRSGGDLSSKVIAALRDTHREEDISERVRQQLLRSQRREKRSGEREFSPAPFVRLTDASRWLPLLAASVMLVTSAVLFFASRVSPLATVGEKNGAATDTLHDQAAPFSDQAKFLKQTRISQGSRQEFGMPSGVQVTVMGPAEFRVTGRNELQLLSGNLTASVPEDATGFRVVTPNGDVIDHGTEIGVAVSSQHTELHVFEGKAEVVLSAEARTSMLGFNEAVRVYSSENAGYEPIEVSPGRFGRHSHAQRIQFGFDSGDPIWKPTLMGGFSDRGDRPATKLTAGEARFERLLGFATLPSHHEEVGRFHEGPQFHAPQAGDGRIVVLPFHQRDSMPSLCLTSPPFYISRDSGPLTAYITGGRGHAERPPRTFGEIPSQADGNGFLGLALRRVRDGRYLCSARRHPGNFYEWAQVAISQAEISRAVAGDSPDEVYVLDIVDTYRDPNWSWIGVDSVSVPGRLVKED